MPAFLFIDVDKDNVTADLHNAAPRNKELKFSAEKAAEFSGTGYDQRGDAAASAVDLQIADAAKRTAGLYVDHFLLL